MTTRDMLELLKKEGYPLKTLCKQAGVSYMKAHRHYKSDGVLDYLSDDEKAALWRVGRQLPTVDCALYNEMAEDAGE